MSDFFKKKEVAEDFTNKYISLTQAAGARPDISKDFVNKSTQAIDDLVSFHAGKGTINPNELRIVNNIFNIAGGFEQSNLTTVKKIIMEYNRTDSIMEVAQEGQQPRAFEVVSQLIKNVADTTDKLVDLQQKMKNLEAEDPKGPSTVNNALFVGSTAELQKLLKSQSDTKKTK